MMKKTMKSICFGLALALSSYSVFPQPLVMAQEIVPTNVAGEGIVEEGKQFTFTIDSNLVEVEGANYLLTNAPRLVDGIPYLPLRDLSGQVLAAELRWDDASKQISIHKDAKEIVLTMGESQALADGMDIFLEAAPFWEQGSIFVPTSFLTEQFEIKVDYDAISQTLILTLPPQEPPVEVENQPPVARFRFDQQIYTAGQWVGTFDLSRDPDGDEIVDTLWRFNNDDKIVAKTLSSMFRTPRAGTYDISYKVKDINGLWSDWYTEPITILPNENPVITEFATAKAEYAQGEKIDFSYEYQNEEWEDIITERWTYRPLEVAKESTMTPLKPKALYSPGEYIVTLQIQDEYGNYSDKNQVVVKVNQELVSREMEYKFTHGAVGDTIDNFANFNFNTLKDVSLKKVGTEKGKLVMSDSPEMVSQKGILYQETVWGNGRILIHHVNKFDEEEAKTHNKRLVVTATNNAKVDIDLKVWNKTVRGPSGDVFYLGQQLLYHYFNGAPEEEVTIKPNSTEIIYDNGTTRWLAEQTISGLMDFYAPLPVTFTVVVLDQEDTLETIAALENLPRDIHPRGTFNVLEEEYQLDLSEETEAVKFALGKGMPEWLKGKDGITKETVYNKGNYGMVYRIRVTAQEDTAMLINPRGYSFRGALRWEDDATYYIPAAGNYTGSTNRAAFAGIIPAGETREFSYMLPNGSASPVLFGFIPKSRWGEF